MIRPFEQHNPQIGEQCYIDPQSTLIGDVTIGDHCSVWPFTVIRGDVNFIRIGHHSNIQDGSVLHVSHAGEFNPDGAPLIVGDYVTVGHKVLLHACTIGNDCLIGMGSIVMDNVVVEDQVMIGAASMVPPGKVLKSGKLYLGNPVREVRDLKPRDLEFLRYSAEHYVRLANKYIAASD